MKAVLRNNGFSGDSPGFASVRETVGAFAPAVSVWDWRVSVQMGLVKAGTYVAPWAGEVFLMLHGVMHIQN